ncbi:MAG: hypothetical protein Q9M48_15825, partial [Rhodobacterales bacterium]|nr:hypothetical protein [Rhodobacterales bacterium]
DGACVPLTIVLIIGGLMTKGQIEPSLSNFFHTTLRDIFVGTLFAIGIFLISYKGYQRDDGEWFSDDLIATIAGISAFGVALFPNESPTQKIETVFQEALGLSVSPLFHYASALTFFFCLGAFCFVKFPKNAKPFRRKIYLACGWVIVLATIVIAGASYFKIYGENDARDFVIGYYVVFWAEAAGVWAFAISWLTKGKADMAMITAARKVTGKSGNTAPK